MANSVRKVQKDILYPELSYEVIGAAFEVYNKLGWGHKEVYYQRALAEELTRRGIAYAREKGVQLEYDHHIIGRYVLDFIVDDKIVVELKTRSRLGYTHIKQVTAYLKQTGLQLAILIYFTEDGVKYRRVLASRAA